MATFPDSPIHPRNPQVGTGGFVAPGAPTIQPNPLKPKVASLFTPQPGGNQTLQALMLRQKELAQRGGEMPQIQSWTQGLAHALGETMTGIEEGRVRREQERGNAAVANAFSSVDPATGLMSPEAAGSLSSWNPELAASQLAAYREQQNANALLEIQKQKLAAETASAGAAKLSDVSSMVGHVIQDPAYKNLTQAEPIWSSMTDAYTRDTPQADLNMVIGLAKLFDPTSVVRTQEGEQVVQTGGLPAEIYSQWKYLTGEAGARLRPEVRQGMMEEGWSRTKSYIDAYGQTQKFWTDYAARHGMDPSDIPQLGANLKPFTPPEAPDEEGNPDEVTVDPATLPSIKPEDMEGYNTLPEGAQYTVPGYTNPDGQPTIFTKRATPPAAGAQ